jgi:hypothetical protein
VQSARQQLSLKILMSNNKQICFTYLFIGTKTYPYSYCSNTAY